MLARIRNVYKFLVAATGALVIILNQLTPVFSFLPPSWQPWITVVVSGVTAFSVWLVKNQPLVQG